MGKDAGAGASDPAALEAQIVVAREQLAATIDAIAARVAPAAVLTDMG